MTSRLRIRALVAVLFALLPVALVAQTTLGNGLHIVQPFPTKIALTATPSSASSGATVVTAAALTAAGSGTLPPTGSIVFTLTPANGSRPVTTTVPVRNGGGAWSIVPPSGANKIEATYSGDTNYRPAQAATSVNITAPSAPDFDFTLPSVTIVAGQSYDGRITVTPKNGFQGNVTFTVGPLPKDVTFALPNPTIEVASGSADAVAAPIPFAIGTKATVVTAAAGFLFLGLFGFRPRQRPRRRAFVLIAMLGALAVMAGCAATRFVQQNGTQPGTYSIPITATSGTLTHTHDLKLIVQANSN